MGQSRGADNTARRRIHEAALRLYATRGGTDLTIRELASEAGVARGTVYHYIQTAGTLFEHVAEQTTSEMFRRVHKSVSAIPEAADPAARLAIGIRLHVRRAHEEPHWGRFISSFGLRGKVLQELWDSVPMQYLITGIQAGQFQSQPERLRTTMSLIAAVVAGAVQLVSMGHETWRNAGARAVEFVLQALGVPAATASSLANQELPPLLPDD